MFEKSSTPILVTVPEALRLVQIGRSFLYELLSDGSIRSVKAGKRRLVSVDSLKSWAESLPTAGLNPPIK